MDATVIYGVSIYATVANIWFLLSAFSTDVLWIRFYLLMAYVFLFIGGWTNFPPWGTWGRVQGSLWLLGAILWPFFVGLIHLYGFLALLWDERKIKFDSEVEEQIWRMVHRRSGMGRLEFKHALKLGKLEHYKAGEVIYDTEGRTVAKAMSLHMMIEGLGKMSVRHESQDLDVTLRSGYMFDLAMFNFFGVYIGLERSAVEKVVAKTDVLLLKWDVAAVEQMAGGSYPALAAFWRNLILYTLACAFSKTFGDIYASNGQREDPEFIDGGRSRDMLEPFDEREDGSRSWMGWIKWLISIHNPIPPEGIRHNSMPTSGMLARGRMLAESTDRSNRSGIATKLAMYESMSFNGVQAYLV